MNTEERLLKLLDARDEEIAALQDERDTLQHRLAGTPWSWFVVPHKLDEQADDPELPVPRLEFAWLPGDTDKSGKQDWYETIIVYRLVMRHLSGTLWAIPFSCTRRTGNEGEFAEMDLPLWDGPHAAHDSTHLGGLPVFMVLNGVRRRVNLYNDYERQMALGSAHRRADAAAK